MKVYYLPPRGHPWHEIEAVCARDAIDAHSQVWFKIDTKDHKHVDTFEIVTIEMCAHQKGVIV